MFGDRNVRADWNESVIKDTVPSRCIAEADEPSLLRESPRDEFARQAEPSALFTGVLRDNQVAPVKIPPERKDRTRVSPIRFNDLQPWIRREQVTDHSRAARARSAVKSVAPPTQASSPPLCSRGI